MNLKGKEFWIVVVVLVISAIYTHLLRYSRVEVEETVKLENFPAEMNNWKMSQDYVINDQTLDILKSDQYIWRLYNDQKGDQIGMFLSYFEDQKYGAQIHSPKHCLPGGGWKIIDKKEVEYSIAKKNYKVNKMIINNSRSKEIMIYWFWTRSGIITSELGLKIDLAKNALLRNPTDAAFVRINVPYQDGKPDEVDNTFPSRVNASPTNGLYEDKKDTPTIKRR